MDKANIPILTQPPNKDDVVKKWHESRISMTEEYDTGAVVIQEQTRLATANDAMLDESAVLQRLGKSRATLWRWNASGYLTCYKIGGKNCYKQSDVERIEKGLR